MPEFSSKGPGPPVRGNGLPVGDVAVGTVISTNFLPFARVLAQSLREKHPGIPFYALLSEEAEHEGLEDENIRFIPLSAIGVTEIERIRFRYSRRILPLALKPHVLEHLLDLGFARAILLDSDMLITGDMSPLLAMAVMML